MGLGMTTGLEMGWVKGSDRMDLGLTSTGLCMEVGLLFGLTVHRCARIRTDLELRTTGTDAEILFSSFGLVSVILSIDFELVSTHYIFSVISLNHIVSFQFLNLCRFQFRCKSLEM
jgi:hypothetical protein